MISKLWNWLTLFAVVALISSVANGAPKGVAPKGHRIAPPPLSENARKHFNAGVAYIDDPSGAKWEEAYRQFLLAYADTSSFELKNNIGLCALTLERDGEAIEAYKEYLAGGGEPDLSAKARKQIETDIATLSASLVRVEITAEPAEATVIDERKNANGKLVVNNYSIGAGKASLGLHPGRHKISVEAPGYVSEEWIVDAAPASTHSHHFRLSRANPPDIQPAIAATLPSPAMANGQRGDGASAFDAPRAARSATPIAVYVGAAATGLFVAAATVTGLVTLSKEKRYESAATDAEADKYAKSGKTFRLATDIEIGAAILSASATAYFYFAAPKQPKNQSGSTLSLKLRPVAGANQAGLDLFGQF